MVLGAGEGGARFGGCRQTWGPSAGLGAAAVAGVGVSVALGVDRPPQEEWAPLAALGGAGPALAGFPHFLLLCTRKNTPVCLLALRWLCGWTPGIAPWAQPPGRGQRRASARGVGTAGGWGLCTGLCPASLALGPGGSLNLTGCSDSRRLRGVLPSGPAPDLRGPLSSHTCACAGPGGRPRGSGWRCWAECRKGTKQVARAGPPRDAGAGAEPGAVPPMPPEAPLSGGRASPAEGRPQDAAPQSPWGSLCCAGPGSPPPLKALFLGATGPAPRGEGGRRPDEPAAGLRRLFEAAGFGCSAVKPT